MAAYDSLCKRCGSLRQHMTAYGSLRQLLPAYDRLMAAFTSLRQHTTAYDSVAIMLFSRLLCTQYSKYTLQNITEKKRFTISIDLSETYSFIFAMMIRSTKNYQHANDGML